MCRPTPSSPSTTCRRNSRPPSSATRSITPSPGVPPLARRPRPAVRLHVGATPVELLHWAVPASPVRLYAPSPIVPPPEIRLDFQLRTESGSALRNRVALARRTLSRRPSMKITAVEPLVLGTSWRNLVFITVRTDEGLYGIGECTIQNRERGRARLFAGAARRHVIGSDPFNIETCGRGCTATISGGAG